MSLLFDKLLLSAPPSLLAELKKAEAFDVTRLVGMPSFGGDKLYKVPHQFVDVRTPFPDVWLEWEKPYVTNGGRVLGVVKLGALVLNMEGGRGYIFSFYSSQPTTLSLSVGSREVYLYGIRLQLFEGEWSCTFASKPIEASWDAWSVEERTDQFWSAVLLPSLLSLRSLMTRSSIIHIDVKTPSAKPARRLSRGKLPLVSYREISMVPGKDKYVKRYFNRLNALSQSGFRWHQVVEHSRNAHERMLPDGRLVPVKAAPRVKSHARGNSALGSVHKRITVFPA